MITQLIGLLMSTIGFIVCYEEGFTGLPLTWLIVGFALFMVKGSTQSD